VGGVIEKPIMGYNLNWFLSGTKEELSVEIIFLLLGVIIPNDILRFAILAAGIIIVILSIKKTPSQYGQATLMDRSQEFYKWMLLITPTYLISGFVLASVTEIDLFIPILFLLSVLIPLLQSLYIQTKLDKFDSDLDFRFDWGKKLPFLRLALYSYTGILFGGSFSMLLFSSAAISDRCTRATIFLLIGLLIFMSFLVRKALLWMMTNGLSAIVIGSSLSLLNQSAFMNFIILLIISLSAACINGLAYIILSEKY
jgi:hypothetical protein